jgi:hypothetical protein
MSSYRQIIPRAEQDTTNFYFLEARSHDWAAKSLRAVRHGREVKGGVCPVRPEGRGVQRQRE